MRYRSLLLVGLVAVALLLSAGVVSAKKPPKPPPDPEPEADPAIAYAEEYKKRGWTCRKLMVMNADGSNKTLVYDAGGAGFNSIDWSPDATRLVFILLTGQGSTIYVVNVDGTGLTPIFEAPNRLLPGRVAWSPGPVPGIGENRERIAFADWSASRARYDVFLMDTDGSDIVQITPTDRYADFWPTWSPDGSRLVAMVSDREDNDREDLWSLYDFTTDTYAWRPHVAPLLGQAVRYPSWARTQASEIAWAVTPDPYIVSDYDIWITDIEDPDSPIVTRLTNTPDRRERNVSWSEDDSAMVCTRETLNGTKVSSPVVEVLDVANPANRQVLAERARNPAWRR